MKAPDKIYANDCGIWYNEEQASKQTEQHIRKEVLLEWAEKELERLYELIPDAHKVEDETATPMEIRYLGQYMQMERVIDKLNLL